MNLYDFSVRKINGEYESLSKYKGKVVLIVNTATRCGFTPQLNDLEALYSEYSDKGLEILSFPCDQFNHQAPESDEEIQNICSLNYHVTFPQYAKIDVNGDNAIPLYKWITENTVFRGLNESFKNKAFSKLLRDLDANFQRNGKIKWNFTKILIDQNGNIVERFESPVPVKLIELRIKELLKCNGSSEIEAKTGIIDNIRGTARLKNRNLKIICIAFAPIILMFWIASTMSMIFSSESLTFAKAAMIFLKISPFAVALEVGLYFILRKFLSQTIELSNALEIATSGNLDYRFTWKHGDPMAPIYANYNQMCQQLKATQNQMQEAVLNANRASEAKSNFLSNMSHEIRTPINAVLGLDEMIVRESRESNIKSYAIDIKSAGKSLLSLVNDILDFSKIESGKMNIIPVEYDLSSVINDLLNMTNDKAAQKGLSLKVNVDETTPHILYGDEIRIKQVALNILSNAVKYTDNGYVELNISHRRVDNHNIMLIFHIIDTGKGIKKEDLDKLFTPFERIEEKRNRNIEGTGLGMNITKQLLDMMNSRLNVDSTYGEGSDFSFEILQSVVSEEPIGDFAESYRRFKENAFDYRESFHAPNARILVVDDIEMNLKVFTSLLKMTQIQIDTASSGAMCIELASVNKYDIIFIDHMMPNMDGIETLDVLKRECGKNSDTPVIILTANAVSGVREKYIAEGFSDYLTKPIDGMKLEATIASFLPERLVIKDFDADEIQSEMFAKDSTSVESIFSKLCKIDGIDTSSGISATGSIDAYVDIAKIFATTGEDKYNVIKEFQKSLDIKNYTIQVHALKSSARLIGANALSDSAKYLEQMGRDENINQINAKTNSLLEEYKRIYTALLEIYVSDTAPSSSDVISADTLAGLLGKLRDAVENYDYTAADSVMDEFSGYQLPDTFSPVYKQLQTLVSDIDQDGILSVIDNYIKSL